MKNFSDFGYKSDIMFNMTIEITDEYAGNNCCAACTCEDPHRSKPE
jgi:hypothetical protein